MHGSRPPLSRGSKTGAHTRETSVQAGAPWPQFRRDSRNTGCSPIRAVYNGGQPWSFQTGKGIFSTPVIDENGVIYVGSADHCFYALNEDGSEKWRFLTGEMIDSAGALPHIDPAQGATVLVPSGDGFLYHLRCEDGQLIWRFDARIAPRASYNNWFEANIALGSDGTIYAGNTNFNYYAISPEGNLKWTYPTKANAWSAASFADDGTIYWTSCDTFIHAVRPDGSRKWRRRTLGFVSASVAVGSDGALYVGSFDSLFYALNPHNGQTRWTFRTGDHIYGSAALEPDESGTARAIYIGSTDGLMYALSTTGSLLWAYDTGAPIRSSPALGKAPEGEDGYILYFGCGNGRLYALNTRDGSLRWSYDTTDHDDPDRADRNDLNGSPALGKTGVVIGGEHGQIWHVPYDYPLHAHDPRSNLADLPTEMSGMVYVSPGGNLRLEGEPVVPPAVILTLRLVVREKGQSVHARFFSAPVGRPGDALQITAEPHFPFDVETSADGRYLHIIPRGYLEPDTTYTLHIQARTYTGGLHVGNLTLGGRRLGWIDDHLTFRTVPAETPRFPLGMAEETTGALEWTRLAVPVPPMLPSLNQIGFDYMDWILGIVAITPPDAGGQGHLVLWAIGGRRDKENVLVADPGTDFTLPLSGTYRADSFILANHSFKMAVTGIPIPFNTFELRGQIGPDGRLRSGATAYAETRVLGIPTFGPLLVIAGLANNWWQKLLAVSTYITRPYTGPANRRPAGIEVTALDFHPPTQRDAGCITAHFTLHHGAQYPLHEHRPGIVLLDGEQTEAVSMDYHANLSAAADQQGNLASVTLVLPARTALPDALEAVIMLDVFPFYRKRL